MGFGQLEISTIFDRLTFFRKCIGIHLDDPMEKFNLLIFMTQKLFACAGQKNVIEGADATMMQECLLGGHLYLQVLKEKMYMWLTIIKMVIMKRAKNAGNRYKLTVCEYFIF